MQVCFFLFLVMITTLHAPESLADGRPLFASSDTLEIVLEVPMKTLIRRAKKKPVLDGQLRYLDADGGNVTIDLTITTRGKSRLDLCSFPPLSITLDKKQTPSTLFAGQRKLKIVSQCLTGSWYRRYFYQEYGIYRAYNLLSDHSFQVRMLNVTFRDNAHKRRDLIVPAFFIESNKNVAERMNMKTIKTESIKPNQFNIVETSKYEVFQYMIGNTDWSILEGPKSEGCCHNGKVIGPEGTEENWVVLPYDFDQSGIINTEYALPAIGIGVRTVRQRAYRGRCRHNGQFDETIALFNERRSEIEAALTPPAMSKKSQKTTLRYVSSFYEIINDPEEVSRRLVGKCRGA